MLSNSLLLNAHMLPGARSAAGLQDDTSVDDLIADGHELEAPAYRNSSLCIDDAQLRADGNTLVEQGFTALLKEDEPYLCAICIAQNIDWNLTNLC